MAAERDSDPTGETLIAIVARALRVLPSIFPLIYAVTVAFESYQILIPVLHRFIGLRNFERIYLDPLFWKCTVSTVAGSAPS